MLKFDTISYKPLNLPKDYEQDELKVRVDYTFEGNGYFCGDLPYPKKTIKINSIIKK
jgi:hypothetical protein